MLNVKYVESLDRPFKSVNDAESVTRVYVVPGFHAALISNSFPALFSEIINSFNLFRAKKDSIKIRKKQEDIIDTDTKEIPKMTSIFKGRAEDLNKEVIT